MRSVSLLFASAVGLVVSCSDDEPGGPAGDPIEIEIEMFYQFSATDNDAEVTIDIESTEEAVDELTIAAPDGHTVATIKSQDSLGLAQIEFESAEPSVEQVQAAYPEGSYLFSGQTVEGSPIRDEIELTHDVVAAPDFFRFSPCDEEVDPKTATLITWNAVEGAAGGYEIIIEQDDTGANLRITQGPERTSFAIPDGFLDSNLEYEIEMKSVTEQGSKTSASCGFSTL